MPLDFSALYNQGINALLKQAAEWARIPTRLARAASAIAIVEQAAIQRGNQTVVTQMQGLRQVLNQTQALYANGSGKVADVVDAVRALPPGAIPPISLAPKVAEVIALIAGVTNGVSNIERQIVASSQRVLTPQEQAQLNSGMKFTNYMGDRLLSFAKYAALGIGGYYVLKAFMRAQGARSF
jgi:hypothetical protein